MVQSGGDSVLEEAAAKDVRRWRLAPALRDGEPVAQYVTVKVAFQLVASRG